MRLDTIMASLRPVAEYITYSQRYAGIKGYLMDLEGFTLLNLAEYGPGTGEIVEIGSFMGKSTCWLAQGSKNAARERVHGVDHFRGSPEHQAGSECEEPMIAAEGSTFRGFQENIAAQGLSDYVVAHREGSPEAASGWNLPIRLLFIDGDHSYESARTDFEAWAPFVVDQGLIAFHDVDNAPGVTRFYRELLTERAQEFSEQIISISLRVVQKHAPLKAN